METADSVGHQLSQCGSNDMLDVPLGALYRTRHVVKKIWLVLPTCRGTVDPGATARKSRSEAANERQV